MKKDNLEVKIATCINCGKKLHKVSYISCYWICLDCFRRFHNLGEVDRINFKEELKFKLQKKKKSASHL
jgi:hypothetical protein